MWVMHENNKWKYIYIGKYFNKIVGIADVEYMLKVQINSSKIFPFIRIIFIYVNNEIVHKMKKNVTPAQNDRSIIY